MKLLLLRHGDAENKSTTGKDFDRKLSEVGRRQALLVKEQIDALNFLHDASIYCSNAQRTKDTWNIIKGETIDTATYKDELYLASLNQLLTFFWENKQPNNMLFIGHNNGISELASYLLNENVVLPTCGMLLIDFPTFTSFSEISKGTGTLIKFHFPDN
ncbi:MAG: histidine phosphatase family protein [Brumimicrobium sp.]|nr:histidine phosphatase family protein [Brumimicrobium sp.]MCO5268189.1 histidine phosphatase family protein [Brumimicrobium sp.]